jgi:hypothetical protein
MPSNDVTAEVISTLKQLEPNSAYGETRLLFLKVEIKTNQRYAKNGAAIEPKKSLCTKII